MVALKAEYVFSDFTRKLQIFFKVILDSAQSFVTLLFQFLRSDFLLLIYRNGRVANTMVILHLYAG